MPIRINLLAEAQELEEQRRRDPVKRVVIGGIIAVGLILFWSSSLMVKTVMVKSELSRLEGNLNSRTNEYRQILDNQRMLSEDKQKLQALLQLATNRFLMGTLLDALQRTTVENVQLLRVRVDQNYVINEEARPAKDPSSAKPATATEKIALLLSAKDASPNPGDAVSKFQETLAKSPYFEASLAKGSSFRLTSLGAPQTDPDGRSCVLFTLEAHFPDKTR
jgi:hypothetical protein